MNTKLTIVLLAAIVQVGTANFTQQCLEGYIGIGDEIKTELSITLPVLTATYIEYADKIYASLIEKMEEANLDPLRQIKPLLDRYLLGCIQPTLHFNLTLQAQIRMIVLQLNELRTNDKLNCVSVHCPSKFLIDLLELSSITEQLGNDNLTAVGSPLQLIMAAIRKLLDCTLGVLKNVLSILVSFMPAKSMTDLLHVAAGYLSSTVTAELEQGITYVNSALLGGLGENLGAVSCTPNQPCDELTTSCVIISDTLINIIASINVDLYRSQRCLEGKYLKLAQCGTIDDVLKLLL